MIPSLLSELLDAFTMPLIAISDHHDIEVFSPTYSVNEGNTTNWVDSVGEWERMIALLYLDCGIERFRVLGMRYLGGMITVARMNPGIQALGKTERGPAIYAESRRFSIRRLA